MNLTLYDFKELLEVAKKAALSSNKIIQSALKTEIKAQTKDSNSSLASSLVTKTDFESQMEILNILAPCSKKYDIGILTEESSDDKSRLIKDFFWCIDPLDGTLFFSKKQNGHSISIALVDREGVAHIGVVLNSSTQDLYYAIKGQGALKNDQKFTVHPHSEHLTLIYDISYLNHPQFDSHMELITKRAKTRGYSKVYKQTNMGAVLNAIGTIEQSSSIYFKLPKKELGGGSLWDFAATSVIQAEAGGHNCDYFGERIDLNKKDNTFMNDKGIVYTSDKNLIELISGF